MNLRNIYRWPVWPRTRSSQLILALSSLVFLIGAVSAASPDTQQCICKVGVPCERNATALDCPSGRVISRRDCTCCFVCAKQLTESCNDSELPCDTAFGLICGEDSRCKALKSCSDDTQCSSNQQCVGGACAEVCKVRPTVCADEGMTNGICTVRNHRAFCACSNGLTLNSNQECVSAREEGTFCMFNGRKLAVGEKSYMQNCGKQCECEETGEIHCEDLKEPPTCGNGFIAMSTITGEMSDTCKILIGNDAVFDGCCVPETCRNVTSQDGTKSGARDFKLSEAHNNLGDDEDDVAARPRDMLISADDSSKKISSNKPKISSSAPTLIPSSESPSTESGNMGITISSITSHSALVNLPSAANEAILSIALSSELAKLDDDGKKPSERSESFVWREHRIPPILPFLTLSDLRGNTSYTVKYSVGGRTYPLVEFSTLGQDAETMHTPVTSKSSDESSPPPTSPSSTTAHSSEGKTIGTTTGDASSTTKKAIIDEPGCSYNETHYAIGATVNEGCDKKCECMKNGQMKCMDRCSIPFFQKGSFAHDKMCFEEPSGYDECCVIVACARATSGSGEPRELSLNPCDSAKCGKMAECRSEVSPSGMHVESQETLCVCKDGFNGDPYDEVTGCEPITPTPSSTPSSLVNPTVDPSINKTTDGCAYNNKTYGYGEEFLDGCSYKCHCETSGEVLCRPRCSYRHDEQEELRDGCHLEKDPADADCCERLVCDGEALEAKKDKPTPVPINGCVYKNNTYEKDVKFYDGCEQQCMCFSNGDVTCQPRCPPAGTTTLDKDCVTLPDPIDSCCTVTVCGNNTISDDVMKAANESQARNKLTPTEMARLLREEEGTTVHDHDSLERKDLSSKLTIKIVSLTPVNATSMMLSIEINRDHLPVVSNEKITIEYSQNQSSWENVEASIKELFVEGSDEIHTIIHNLVPGKKYYFRANVNGTESNTVSGSTSISDNLTGSDEVSSMENMSIPSSEALCAYKGKMFAAQEEWYDGCESYCMCEENGQVHCEPIECPNEYGLELIDPHCVKWEPVTEKDPPNCCPEMHCVQNSSCAYEGKSYVNLEEIPVHVTGCEKRCSCFFGNVSCTERCIPIPPTPPTSLRCPAESAIRIKSEYDGCCEAWSCKNQPGPATDGMHDHSLKPNKTHTPSNKTNPVTSNIPLQIHHDISGEDDQFVPPSTGNEPTIVSLESLNPHQLQELLHQLSTLAEQGGSHDVGPFSKGTYLSVKNPVEAQEFERSGAKVIGEAEDGSFILFIPSPHGSNTVSDGRPSPDLPFTPHIHPGIQITAPDHFPFNPHDFGQPPIGHTTADEITGVTIRPVNETTLHIDFSVSPVLVGLHGAVEVRFTSEFKRKPNPDQWERQLFQQPEDVIDNSHLQLFLTGLKPDSEYHVQIQVLMTDLHTTPESDIFVIRTPPPTPLTTTLPPEIEIEAELKLMEVTSSSVEVSWRKFTDFEASLIDAVQVRYKAYDDQFYVTTPLIHRSISSYNLTNLHPNTKYEINLLLVPFPNQTTELKSETPIHISTPADMDDYSFTISIETGKITDRTAEIVLVGVPFPEDKFVNIYQVIYQSDTEKEQKSSFKVAKRESSKVATVTDLKPGTRYRVWVEAFLTNGKKKRTEVIDVATKATGSVGAHPQDINELGSHNQLQSDGRSDGSKEEPSNYYGALVALAIITALSITAIVILLMILIKKQNQATIPINDRKSESSYDNPSFKNYDIEANGHSKPGEL